MTLHDFNVLSVGLLFAWGTDALMEKKKGLGAFFLAVSAINAFAAWAV